MRKIPPGAEASNILVGEVEFLDKPLSAFIRLNQGTYFGDLTEVPVPTRFLFVLLGPTVIIFLFFFFFCVLLKSNCEEQNFVLPFDIK